MIVEEIMSRNLITLLPTDKIKQAVVLMNKYHVRHIPVVDKEYTLLGIVSDRDIKDAAPSIFAQDHEFEEFEKPVHKIMTKNVIVAYPLDFVEEISFTFYENKISCLPIIRKGKLVGLVTKTDILNTLVQLTGAHQPGSQIEVKVPNVAGKLSEVTKLLSDHHLNILSVLVYPYKQDDTYRTIVFRIETLNPTKAIYTLVEHGYEVLRPHITDVIR
ncbi:acetoin utilization AcuB family protein [Priestia filamentosa]|uniref:Acetoin utilization protein AcuB n=1 Tax=Priestia filamentosa TaxID=1402861 RepID=A0A1X7CQZ5_9BACI|nr:acetoin utilization AcuB family protein [Priestia filamentosa]AKO94421.1 acetoin utilization protein AcuB [Priestia filamentosa]MDT3764713.1 acetoin utilization AcuB family protein [Priestia filamentosa]OXS70843.1 acetoin utilization protein AcuB [Priestia filamentosa]RJS66474.1 acetoin utilization protein AcuB [Priestia filamentosa]WCM15315.1 acetoin utilization AcuB family protein [Priestia filamentosa]